MVAEAVVCGPDPERHVENIRQAVDAGYDEAYVQQIGPEQKAFFRIYEKEVLAGLRYPATARSYAGLQDWLAIAAGGLFFR